jgi:CheY-like chemotaxis protein
MAKTLLLADDSVTIQRVVELTFAHEDIRVVSVSDGRRAMQWIDTERPDIVVADVGVADVDGYALATHVKKSPALRHIPVLLLAGAFEPVDEGKARASGCDGVVVKPFEPQHLVARVNELLTESQRWAPAERTPAGVAAGAAAGDAPPKPTGPVAAPSPIRGSTLAAEDTLEMDHGGAVESLEPPSSPVWGPGGGSTLSQRASGLPPAKVSLANAFSELLAAEQTRPAPSGPAAPPEIPEAAIEEAVRRILARMTGEAVRQIVLDTAERLIREEIEKIKAAHSE